MIYFAILIIGVSLFLIISPEKSLKLKIPSISKKIQSNKKVIIGVRIWGIICIIIGFNLLFETILSKKYIEINFPSKLVEDISQQDLNRKVKDNIYTKATLNEDGSITYKMTKKQYQKYLSELEILYDDSINEMIDEDDNIIKITRNNNFSSFKVIMNSNKLPNSEKLINNNLSYMGQIYNIYSNSNIEKITIIYYDNLLKEAIKENNIYIK